MWAGLCRAAPFERATFAWQRIREIDRPAIYLVVVGVCVSGGLCAAMKSNQKICITQPPAHWAATAGCVLQVSLVAEVTFLLQALQAYPQHVDSLELKKQLKSHFSAL